MYDHETITPLGNEINPPLESSEISVKAPTYHPNLNNSAKTHAAILKQRKPFYKRKSVLWGSISMLIILLLVALIVIILLLDKQ